LTQPALQLAERRRNMLSAKCSAALNQRETVAIGQAREKSRIEFPVFLLPLPKQKENPNAAISCATRRRAARRCCRVASSPYRTRSN
jgi:hypothetical protein